jgi:hypothetical protein
MPMPTLIAYGNTYHYRKWLQQKGFVWNSGPKEWVKRNVSTDEMDTIIKQCDNPAIKFRSNQKDGGQVQARVSRRGSETTTPKKNDPNEKIDNLKYYSPGYSSDNAPKEYARKIDEPLGSREDYKKDRASWQRPKS